MRLAGIVRMRLRSLFARMTIERELEEELQYHLDRQIEENLEAGMDPQEARWAALRSIGGLEQRKEECRDMRGVNMLDNLIHDLRFAFRQLRKNLDFATTAILMLALGMCASVTIFAFVDAALLKPLPYHAPSRLLGVYETAQTCPRCNLSWPDYLDWKKANTTLSSFDVYTGGGLLMTTPGGPQPVTGARVSDGFFRTLGVAPALGRDFYAGEDAAGAPRTAILSYAAWQARFGGDSNVVGRTVLLDRVPTVIVGVLAKEFHFAPVGTAEFWTPFHPASGCDLRRICRGLYGVGRLRDGISLEAAQANVTSIAQELEKQYPDTNHGQGALVAGLTEIMVGSIRPILLVLMGGAALLLAIAGVNVVGLLLVRSESRGREMAVRTALGASSGRLVGQFVTEAIVLISAGGALGVAASKWMIQLLVTLLPDNVMARTPFLRDIGLNTRVIGFALCVAALAAVLFSLAPSLRIWSPKIRAGLAEGSRGSASTVWRRLGSKLVVLELATAVVLLTGAGLMGKSLYRLLNVDLGLEPDHLVTMDVMAPPAVYGKYAQAVALARQTLERVGNLPGVRSAGLITNGVPLSDNGNTTRFRVVGRSTNGEHNEIPERDVSGNYFSTLGTKLVRGRFFSENEDRSKPPVAIVNRAFERQYFPNGDALGKQLTDFSFPPVPAEIVGVVEDLREGELDAPIPPILYRPFNQSPDAYFSIIVRTAQDERSVPPTLAATMRQIDSGIVPMRGLTMNDRIRESPTAYIHRSTAWLVGGFAGLALVLGIAGLYGVIAYSVSQRTREIGVRMALGARPGTVHQLILKEAGLLILAGIVIGLVCAVVAANLIRGLLFGVTPWDVPTLVAIAVMLGTSALLASFIPARRAASVNPVEALRAE
jgi:macrolide transport system ATP-binding/permease protein